MNLYFLVEERRFSVSVPCVEVRRWSSAALNQKKKPSARWKIFFTLDSNVLFTAFSRGSRIFFITFLKVSFFVPARVTLMWSIHFLFGEEVQVVVHHCNVTSGICSLFGFNFLKNVELSFWWFLFLFGSECCSVDGLLRSDAFQPVDIKGEWRPF